MEEIKIAVSGNYRFEIGPTYFAVKEQGEEEALMTMDMKEATQVIRWLFHNTTTTPVVEPGYRLSQDVPRGRMKEQELDKQQEQFAERKATGVFQQASIPPLLSAPPLKSQDGKQAVYSEAVVDLAAEARRSGVPLNAMPSDRTVSR